VARAEFETLRTEILARAQAQVGIVATALTLVSAVGGFALAKGGTVQILLILPPVLSGLGSALVESLRGNKRLSGYIRNHLWQRFPSYSDAGSPSWEHHISEHRAAEHNLSSLDALSGTMGPTLILVLPSVSALVLNGKEWDGALWPLWWSGVLSITAFAWIASKLVGDPLDT
jgi:hypothetical protein